MRPAVDCERVDASRIMAGLPRPLAGGWTPCSTLEDLVLAFCAKTEVLVMI